MKLDWWTEEHKERMQYRDDLVVYTMGDEKIPIHGRFNEYIAARCKQGQRVRFIRWDGTRGEGIVKLNYLYDGIVIWLECDTMLLADSDLIWAIGGENETGI